MSGFPDSHLTYIGAVSFDSTRYDVYPRDGGAQLGIVEKRGNEWTAVKSCGHCRATARTRWEAATRLWGGL